MVVGHARPFEIEPGDLALRAPGGELELGGEPGEERRLEGDVERNRDRARPQGAEEGGEPDGTVVQVERDSISRPDPARGERRRDRLRLPDHRIPRPAAPPPGLGPSDLPAGPGDRVEKGEEIGALRRP